MNKYKFIFLYFQIPISKHWNKASKEKKKQPVRKQTKYLKFLTPMQLPTKKQWWSNPYTQWSQWRQWDDLAGLMILQVLQ